MLESIVLAVQVGQEVLCALGQVEDRFKVDNLGTGSGHVGEVAGQQTQISQFIRIKFLLCVGHINRFRG